MYGKQKLREATQMPTEEELRYRVTTGARFLDLLDPGWAKRITRKIRVGSTHECVLAQLYGRYRIGFEKYKLSLHDALIYGFRADSQEVRGGHLSFDRYYFFLSEAWEYEVKKRKFLR